MSHQASLIAITLTVLLCILNCSITQSEYIQYGFAHRVNTPSNIKHVLNGGANGIEIDVCFDNSIRDWYVSHNDIECACDDCFKLTNWLNELDQYLNDNESKKTQLAMLWIDIKTPNDAGMNKLPNIIHSAGLPQDIKILYDLTSFAKHGAYGFDQIVNILNDNEGISFFGDSEREVENIYNFYKTKEFKRGTFNQGDAVNTDEEVLSYARNSKFLKSTNNPYGFALTLTWTNQIKSSIEDHTDPNREYYTDGQIYGNAKSEWSDDGCTFSFGGIKLFCSSVSDTQYATLFNNIISNQQDTRLATANDDAFKTSFDVSV